MDFQCHLLVTGIDDALARLEGLERAIKLAIVVELEWFGRVTTQEMVLTHSFTNRTGRLERSIGYSVESWSGNRALVNVFATAPYAQAVEEGTPTSRPYPFFWQVFYKYLPELQQRLQSAVNEALGQYGAVGGPTFRVGSDTTGEAPTPSRQNVGGRFV